MQNRPLPRLLILGRQALAEMCMSAPSLTVTAVVANVEDVIAAAGKVDVVLIDFAMPGAEGLQRLRKVIDASPMLPVLVMIDQDAASAMAKAMDAGAVGFVPPDADAKQIGDAVQVVLAGGSYLDPTLALSMLDRVVDGKTVAHRASGFSLSTRELEVLGLLAEGRSARQMATSLRLSERTINTHVANVYRKLAVSNRVEAVREAIRLGLVSMPG
ncbi:MAG: response regulator transcription factor [Actinomycetota bacterium]